MHKIVAVDMEKSLFEANRALANDNLNLLLKKNVLAFEFSGGIGSGKTLLIEKLIAHFKTLGKVSGALAGDVAGEDDYKRFKAHTPHVVNINTGKECHLDAHLVDHGLSDLELDKIDYLFIENVGNLICPADFLLGANKRVTVISVTEGDDMVRKQPALFREADIIVINKVNLAKFVDVSTDVLIKDAMAVNQRADIILTDAKDGLGIEELSKNLLKNL